MAFIYWLIFILCFCITLFVILISLLKEYHGWKAFLVILAILNVLSIIFYLPLLPKPQIANYNTPEPLYIIGWLGIFARLYMIRTLVIIDIISILLYSVQRFLKGEVKKVGYIIWFVTTLIILSHIYDAFYLINSLINKFLFSVGLQR